MTSDHSSLLTSVTISGDAVTIANANTTIGYARFSRKRGAVEYIFVSPAYRRRGYGSELLRIIENEIQIPLRPEPPLSPLGQRFFDHHGLPSLEDDGLYLSSLGLKEKMDDQSDG